MGKQIHNELKKEFQLERMILFSDAVFAIAITLLVMEIKVPAIARELLSEQALIDSLTNLIPKLTGFIISFLIIGLFWTVHHRMFGYVVAYNNRLLWLNLIFLMAVALMPFSSAFYSEYISKLYQSPLIVYVANISFLGIMNFMMWKYISNPKRKLTEGLKLEVARYYSDRAITVPLVFLLVAIVYFFASKYAVVIPLIIPILMRTYFARRKKKLGILD